jgi:hypothetical protein
MSLDEKDLEIARLRGKVEALEGELAKERAVRAMSSFIPQIVPHPLLPNPLVPNPLVPNPLVPLVPGLPWPNSPMDYSTCGLNVNCQNPTTLGGEVWIGETRPSLDAIVALGKGRALGVS